MDTNPDENLKASQNLSQKSQPNHSGKVTSSKFLLKKRIIIVIIALSLAIYGVFSYLNKSPDPTTWESMRTDYKNTR